MPKIFFTAESGRIAAHRSVEARRLAKLNPPPAEPAEPAPTAQPALEADDYDTRRLARIRKQLDQLDRLIEAETDPQRLDRLASASARLSELARVLAGKPLPGSHRPQRPARGRTGSAPIVPE